MTDIVLQLRPHLIALLIGFIIGLERERAHESGEQALGLRTFSLIGLLGSLAAVDTSPLIGGAIAVFVLLAILLGYFRSTAHPRRGEYGLTTEVAGFVVFILGYLSAELPLMAGVLAAFVLALLAGRNWLHNFTRQKITPKEADALISLIVLGAGILPLLSSEAVDPWGVFVPMKLGSLIWLLALVQFLSYALLKVFGQQAGYVLAGFLSGMVSSTAAFANIREQFSNGRGSFLGHLAYGMMAIAATTLIAVFIIFTSSQKLFMALVWGFVAVIAVAVVLSVLSVFRANKKEALRNPLQDPLNWKKQLSFALGLFVVITLTKISADRLGPEALVLVSFLSGLFELQGVTYAISATEEFTRNTVIAMGLAYVASLISKIFLIMMAKTQSGKEKFLYLSALVLLIVVFVVPVAISFGEG